MELINWACIPFNKNAGVFLSVSLIVESCHGADVRWGLYFIFQSILHIFFVIQFKSFHAFFHQLPQWEQFHPVDGVHKALV